MWVDVPVLNDLAIASQDHAIVFRSPSLTQTTLFCGSPTMQITFTPNFGRWQLVAYLYDVDSADVGTLISHGPVSCWNCTATKQVTETIYFRSLCYQVPEGHRLGVGLNMYSDLYKEANDDSNLTVKLEYGASTNLKVPVKNA